MRRSISLYAILSILMWLSHPPKKFIVHANEDEGISAESATGRFENGSYEMEVVMEGHEDTEDFSPVHDSEEEEHYDDEEGDEYDEEDECYDDADDCAERALKSGCILQFSTMSEDCALTCKLCSDDAGLVTRLNIYSDFPQLLHNDPDMIAYSEQVDEFMYETIYTDEVDDNVKLHCRNKDPQCTFWAQKGLCEQEFVLAKCPAACLDCESVRDISEKCPSMEGEPVMWESGDLHRTFTTIVTSPTFTKYSPTIVSRPNPNPFKKFDEQKGPWVVLLDDFLSDKECEALIGIVGVQDMEEVEGVDEETGAEHSFAVGYCTGECANSDIIETLEQRLEHLTGIPSVNAELFELVKFEEGDFHGTQSDYRVVEYSAAQGPRILSVVLFLNDLPQDEDDEVSNGGLFFEELETVRTFIATWLIEVKFSFMISVLTHLFKQTIRPKLGRAVIFPNVLDQFPMAREKRTHYEKLPVTDGFLHGK